MIVCDTLEEIEALVSAPPQTSPWRRITQDQINAYADVSGDHQWIHVDTERAARESPYGTTIAHGMLTLSTLGRMLAECYDFRKRTSSVFYGFDRLRFVSGVPSGAQIRGHYKVESTRRVGPRTVEAHWDTTIEIEGHEKPAIVARWINRLTY